ncbi:hypothetical protein NU09_0369 [Flavobacterium beibuense]|uniref:Uncharacterized protein n=1 Tax=Flavobacterium beibuense TaxID=657326 RepID=A0A444WIW4_9FLAO|nr:hypothetical protein NU09_0369 [Flavobacterium beibuense]
MREKAGSREFTAAFSLYLKTRWSRFWLLSPEQDIKRRNKQQIDI